MITIFFVRQNFCKEELAAIILNRKQGFHYFRFTDQFDWKQIERDYGKSSKPLRFIFANPNYQLDQLPEHIEVENYPSVDILMEENGCDWDIFDGYKDMGSSAYYAFQVIKTLDWNSKYQAFTQILDDQKLDNDLVQRGAAWHEHSVNLAANAAVNHLLYGNMALSTIGSIPMAHLVHQEIMKHSPGVNISVIHYMEIRNNKLTNKWSIRTSEKYAEEALIFLRETAGCANRCGGEVVHSKDNSERDCYQAGGTGSKGFAEVMAVLEEASHQ